MLAPMKYVPVHQTFTFDPITTPNKNIQSYFMRNDQSFYTRDSLKYPAYGCSGRFLQIVIDSEFIIVQDQKHKVDFFNAYALNLEKYKTGQKCLDSIYNLIFQDIKSRESSSETVSKDDQVQLVVGDFFGRSEIVSFIDILINQLGFKVIMVLPVSLSVSFSLNHNFCAFLFEEGFSLIDDFALIDSFVDVKKETNSSDLCNFRSPTRVDDEDFAEEFSRISVVEGKFKYSCNECGQKDETVDKIQSHILKDHKHGTFYFYEDPYSGSRTEKLHKRMKYLFSTEKYEKIAKNIICVEANEKLDNNTQISREECLDLAIKGAQVFFNLDASKDLWMTEHEWRSVRLRALKEKMLFYI